MGKSFEEAKKNDNNEQNNFCGECNCSCTCNADCEGDVKKCTSQKAHKKQCVHCCDCFITPFLKAYGANSFDKSINK